MIKNNTSNILSTFKPFSHYKNQLSVTPPGTSSSSDSDDSDDDEKSSDSGCKNVWERAKEMIGRLGSESSSSDEGGANVRGGDRATGRYTSTNDEDEGIQSKGSDK